MRKFFLVDAVTPVRWLPLLLGVALTGCASLGGPVTGKEGTAPVGSTPPALYTPQDETAREASRMADAVFHYLLGERLLQESNWSQAEEEFTLACEADPNAVEPRFLVAQLATQRGDLDKALTYANDVARLDPKNLKNRLLLAGIQTTRRQYEEALVHYEALLESNPENVQARLLMAQIYGKVKRLEKASEVLSPLFKREDAWRAYLAMGRAHVEQGDMQGAVKPFEEAFRRAPANLETVLALGAAYQDLNRVKDTERVYRKFLSEHPENTAIHSRLGQLLLQRNDREAALAEFRAITKVAPDSVQAWLATSLILLSRGQYEEALKDLRLAEAVQPDNPGVRYYLGQALESLGRNEEAAALYEKIEPDVTFHFESQLRLAFMEAEGKQGAQAAERLRILAKKHGDRVEMQMALSIVLLQEKDYAGVVEACTRGLTLDAAQYRLLFHRAMALDKLERWSDAEKDLLEYLLHAPGDYQALNYLGYTWADRGEHLEEAYKLLKKASELAPSDGFITDSLGWVLYRLNRLEESLTVMRQAVRLVPDDPTVVEHLGDVLKALGRNDEALAQWKRSLEMDGTNQKVKEKISQHESAPR